MLLIVAGSSFLLEKTNPPASDTDTRRWEPVCRFCLCRPSARYGSRPRMGLRPNGESVGPERCKWSTPPSRLAAVGSASAFRDFPRHGRGISLRSRMGWDHSVPSDTRRQDAWRWLNLGDHVGTGQQPKAKARRVFFMAHPEKNKNAKSF